MVTTRPPKTIVKPTALGPVANTDTKLLIYGLFQKGRVLAQDGIARLRAEGLLHDRDSLGQPWRLVTDKLRSYSAAHREVMPSVVHCTDQYQNNRAEVSHEPTRQRERQMRRFKSPGQAQRFLSVHGLVQNLFRVGRHLLQARHHRQLRGRAFLAWDAVTWAA